MGRRLAEVARIRFKVVAKTKQEATAATLVATGLGCTLASSAKLGIFGIEFARSHRPAT